MGRVLAFGETRGGELRGVAREAVAAARELAEQAGGSVDALVLGPEGTGSRVGELGDYGAERIFVAEDVGFAAYSPDGAVEALTTLTEQEDYLAVVFPASAQGKDLSPRLAARLDRPLATEVTRLGVEDGRPVVVRPQFAGKALARVAVDATPGLISVRPNVFLPEEAEAAGEVVPLEVDIGSSRHEVSPVEAGEKDELDVSEASIVVSGGRGMQGPENWHLLEDLADALGDGVALGASRAVVDAGWRPHAEQVGQTGKVVSPNLYLAIGISGAIQHLAGMRTSKVIVAVNKDPEAPIFDVADYGVVGDLFEVVPRVTEAVRSLKSGDD